MSKKWPRAAKRGAMLPIERSTNSVTSQGVSEPDAGHDTDAAGDHGAARL